jgi:hypothetical protein
MLDLSPNAPYFCHALAPTVARAVLSLIKACAQHLCSQPAWAILLRLLQNTCSHPHSVPAAIEALTFVTLEPGATSAANFMEAVDAVREVARRASVMLRSSAAERSFGVDDVRHIVSMLEGLTQWLITWRLHQVQVRLPATAFPALPGPAAVEV